MTIRLRIENCDQLPDGGPMEFTSRGRGFEIGREQHLDWTLPDPSRFISGRHCEVRFEKGGYYLYDVSRNGTFLNGSQSRMRSPYRLENGDSIQIGPYLVSAAVQAIAAGDEAADFGGAPAPASGGDSIWDTGQPAPAPVNRRDFMPAESRGRRAPDFAEQFMPLPQMRAPAPDHAAAPHRAPGAAPSGAFDPPSVRPAHESPFGPAPTPAPLPSEPAAYPAQPGHDAFPAAPRAAPEGFVTPVARPRPSHVEPPPFAPPPPVAAPSPAAPAASPSMPGSHSSSFLRAFAEGAGVQPEVFARRNPDDVAREIGAVMAMVVDQLGGLLKARAAAKAMTKSTKRTMLGATDNNPLKFVPTTPEILEVMFSGRRGYLDAQGSFSEAFKDLEAHEIATFAAMQKALSKLLDSISPQTIEGKLPSSAFSLKKARAWDAYVERWDAMTDAHEHGILNVFLAHFAEAYDEATRNR
jgi:type VI secretion system protein ImpI